METTRVSLIERAKNLSNDRAWEEFYAAYWGVILRYATKLGLGDAEAKDVLQETMIALMRALPEFHYDRSKGRFRNFLLTITHRRALAVLRRGRRLAQVSLDEADPATGSPRVEALAAEPDDSRWQESIYEEALGKIRGDPSIQPATLAIFEDYVIQGLAADDVAERHGTTRNAVYQIRNRLMKRLGEEVALLQEA